jgi:hypothetical protein
MKERIFEKFFRSADTQAPLRAATRAIAVRHPENENDRESKSYLISTFAPTAL